MPSFPISDSKDLGLGAIGGGTQAPILVQGVGLVEDQDDPASGAVWCYPSSTNPTTLTGQVPGGLIFGLGSYAGQVYVVDDSGAPVMFLDNGALVGTLVVDSLDLGDNDPINFGDANDIVMKWDGTRFAVTQATPNSEIRWGVDGAGMDQRWYGDTASAAVVFDQSLDALTFEGVASIRGIRTSSTTAAAITGATVLTLADSGGVFSVSQASAYDIDLPSPTSGPGCRYTFYLTGPAANNVTITVAGGGATFVGTIVNDVTSVIPATGNTLTFASGAAALGDNIEIISISTSLYLVRAVTSAAGGITIA